MNDSLHAALKITLLLLCTTMAISCSGLAGAWSASTPSLSPTSESAREVLAFSPENASRVPPEDILQQIGYGGAYGGSASCHADSYSAPAIDASFIDTYDGAVEQMEAIVLGVCGLAEGDAVTIRIHSPDGTIESWDSIVSSEVVGVEADSFRFSYTVDLDQPAGPYRFEFVTPKGTAEATLDVIAPDGPRLYARMQPDTSELILFGFKGEEKVRLLLYKGSQLEAWQEVTVDARGRLTVSNGFEGPGVEGYDGSLDGREGRYMAVGERSGQAGFRNEGWYGGYSVWDNGDVYCPGAPPPVPGLSPGKTAEVVSENAFGYLSSLEGSTKVSLPKGTRFQIFGSAPAYCQDESFRWGVICDQAGIPGLSCGPGSLLWVPEGVGQDMFLQAVP